METLFRKYFWSFHLVFLAIAAFIAAHTANAVLGHFIVKDMGFDVRANVSGKKAPPVKSVKRDFDAVNDRNIFGAKREEILAPGARALDDMVEAEEEIPNDWSSAEATSLRLRLVGTAVFEYPGFSLASISESGKKNFARAFSINPCEEEPPTLILFDDDEDEDEDKFNTTRMNPCNEIEEGVILHRIEEERVYFFNDNEKQWEYLDIYAEPKKGNKKKKGKKKKGKASKDEMGKGIKKVGGNSYEVEQSEIDGALANLSKLATQARVVPAFEGGESIGFKLFSIRPNSLYAKIGLKNGDIVTRINGYEINSPDKALEIYQKLKDSKQINVDLKRRGKATTLDYAITP
jgi:general secretion pathway protein C